MILVMPMAGLGTRVKSHFNSPKPFIEIQNQPLFAHVLSGLPLNLVSEIIFPVNELDRIFIEALPSDYFSAYLPPELPHSMVFMATTGGQAETVFLATQGKSADAKLLVASSDTIATGEIPAKILDLDGGAGTFVSDNPGMSYFEIQGDFVTRAVEKVVISEHASSGVYFFSSLRSFRKAFLNNKQTGESYIAPLYNDLIAAGAKIGIWEHDEVIPLGTSEEILTYLRKPL